MKSLRRGIGNIDNTLVGIKNRRKKKNYGTYIGNLAYRSRGWVGGGGVSGTSTAVCGVVRANASAASGTCGTRVR